MSFYDKEGNSSPCELYLYGVYIGNLSSFYTTLTLSGVQYIQVPHLGATNATVGFITLGKLPDVRQETILFEQKIWTEVMMSTNPVLDPDLLLGDCIPCDGCGSVAHSYHSTHCKNYKGVL